MLVSSSSMFLHQVPSATNRPTLSVFISSSLQTILVLPSLASTRGCLKTATCAIFISLLDVKLYISNNPK